MDFTLKKYQQLLAAKIAAEALFIPLHEYIEQSHKSFIILRHDVDRLPTNALKMAKLENELGIQSTYFFRTIPETFQPDIISEIASLGHEIGYHYEDLTLTNGNIDKAYDSFCRNLEKLRKLYPVKTICMHGSPLSKWDSRKIWEKYDYRKLGIIGEPYFDVDYNKVFYITDTGRKWNNASASIRDKVDTCYDIRVKSTRHLIHLLNSGALPDKLMINVHPHRWFNPGFMWLRELIYQNVKNVIKMSLILLKRRR